MRYGNDFAKFRRFGPFFLDFSDISWLEHSFKSSQIDWLVGGLEPWNLIVHFIYGMSSFPFGYGSKLGTPIIGWLILN